MKIAKLGILTESFVQKGIGHVAKNLQRGVDKGKMTAAEKDAVLARISGTTKLEDLAGCDLVVEAGWLAKKTGRGFYDYGPGAVGEPA
jgi:3-hydroxyacyl-CoA dehydrogenase